MAEKIVIASGKGGVGKTSLTVGFGKALSAMGYKVLLVDCDCLRSIDLLVGVTEQLVYDWGDVLGGADSEDALYRTKDVAVLTCPDSYGDYTGEDMKKLLALYDEEFDYILIDAPAGADTGLTLSAAAADRAIVVSTPDLVCVRSACIAAGKIYKMDIDDVRLIINRLNRKDILRGRLLNIDAVIDSTQVQLIGIVPEDPKIRLGSMGMNIYRKSQISYDALTNIARRIRGEYVPLEI